MPTQSNQRFVASPMSCSRLASGASILVGCFVLIGWIFDVPLLKSVFPGLVTMKANTAICFILAGVALWLRVAEREKGRMGEWGNGGVGGQNSSPTLPCAHSSALRLWVANVCAVVVALVGLLTLFECLFGWDLGIDQLLFKDGPGRMSPATALSFLLVGLALLFPAARRTCWPTQLLTLSAFLILMLALIGYVYGVKSLYRITPYSSMALHTAATFVLLCTGILSVDSGRGLMAVVTGEGAGSFMARRLLPVAIGVPFVMGWLRLIGQRVGLYDTEFGLAVFALSNIIIFTVLIVWNA
ncbi:MAG: hypothetical protein HY318_12780, partial [Armatimonadetes bacterium]|nr:hypothetical protein [Armatimonadota bacterium]